MDEPVGATVDRAGFVWFVGAGYGIEWRRLRASAMLSLPLTSRESEVGYGLSGFVAVGGDIALWAAPAKPTEQRPAH